MRVYVSRKVLVAMAGLVWIAAGANILKIGIYTWINDALQWQLKLAGAVVIFCLFFFLIFKSQRMIFVAHFSNSPGVLTVQPFKYKKKKQAENNHRSG